MSDMDEFSKLVLEISDSKNTDFYLYSDSIYDAQCQKIIEILRQQSPKRDNAGLILCTLGGSPDAAYQITRCFKRFYKKFNLYVFGNCKSAGTLIAVGADEIVMSEFGHFGPLDVQLANKEEFYGQTAALDVKQALTTISQIASDNFMDYFLKLDPGKSLSTKAACEIAKSLSLGIVEPIASQIDPLLLGQVDRSMRIAGAYIDRLRPNFLGKSKLISDYPSHSFAIDFQEAKGIFPLIREPDEHERQVENKLRSWNRLPNPNPWIGVLSPPKVQNDEPAIDNSGPKPADPSPA